MELKELDELLDFQQQVADHVAEFVDLLLKKYDGDYMTLAFTMSLVTDLLIKRGLAEHIHIAPEVMNEISQYQVEKFDENPLSQQGIVEQTLALNANLQMVLLKLNHITRMIRTKEETTDDRDATTIRSGTETTSDADPSA
jgi:hypothetical protein